MNKCLTCGKLTKNKKFCSHDCQKAFPKHTDKVCKFCGETFKAYKNTLKFCSKQCYYKYRTLTSNVTLRCRHCEELFRVQLCRADKAIFCSNKCRGDYQAEQNRKKKEAREKLKMREYCATCKHCQQTAEPYGVRGCWMCADKGSKFYKSLLNIDKEGLTTKHVTWAGCDRWKIAQNKRQVKRRVPPMEYKLYEARLKTVLDEKWRKDIEEAKNNVLIKKNIEEGKRKLKHKERNENATV